MARQFRKAAKRTKRGAARARGVAGACWAAETGSGPASAGAGASARTTPCDAVSPTDGEGATGFSEQPHGAGAPSSPSPPQQFIGVPVLQGDAA